MAFQLSSVFQLFKPLLNRNKQTHCVLLPGLDGSGQFFAPFLETLPSFVHPQIISYPFDGCADYDQVLEFVQPLLPTDRDYFIVAESFSGPAALQIGLQRPKGLKGIILVASFCSTPLSQGQQMLALNSMNLLRFPIPSAVFNRVLCNGQDLDLARQINEVVRQLSSEVLIGRVKAAVQIDITNQLDQLELPTLAVVAENDRLLGRHAPELVARHVKMAEIVFCEGPHCLLQCNAQAVVEEIVLFLKQSAVA